MASSSVLNFVIVSGRCSDPIYELDLQGPGKEQQTQYLHQFILHSSLDSIDDGMWSTKECHLKTTDRFNNLLVTAYVTPGSSAKFLLLHEGRNDDNIKTFFGEVYDLYVRIMLNPFHGPTTKILSKEFDKKVRMLARRFLG